MRRWWQIGTRNWSVDRGPTVATAVSVALGVAVVVVMTCFSDSTLRALREDVVARWIGRAHLSIAPPGAHWGKVPARLADKVARLDNVAQVTARLTRRVTLIPPSNSAARPFSVDLVGIEPRRGRVFLTLPQVSGRWLADDDRRAVMIESGVARELGVSVGDSIGLAVYEGATPTPFTIVGQFQSQRLAEFQRPLVYAPLADVQALKQQPGQATVIDIQLKDASVPALAKAEAQVRDLVKAEGVNGQVRSAAGRLAQLEEAERITRLTVYLTAAVALATAFFIILTTMSAAPYKRTRELGILRCTGLTRRQLVGLVFVQVTPPTLLGVVGGVPLGMGLTYGTVWLVQRLSSHHGGGGRWAGADTLAGSVSISVWGIGVALVCVAATWAVCMLILSCQVLLVSPLSAANPQARPTRERTIWWAFTAGLVLLGTHEFMLRGGMDPGYWLYPSGVFGSLLCLGGGFVLVTPALVRVLGAPAAGWVGRLFRLHPSLVRSSLGRAPWLSAGVCWALMAGLGLVVFSALRGASILGVWEFADRIPEAFVWTPDFVEADVVDPVRAIPAVAELTVVTDVPCEMDTEQDTSGEQESLLAKFTRQFSRPVFVAGDVDTFLKMAKLGVASGSLEEARRKLSQGGYVLLPPQAARVKGLAPGDQIRITLNGRTVTFTVADIVDSPALDMAVTFFGADTYMQLAAASAILGTRADLRDRFEFDKVGLVLCNLNLPASEPPPSFDATDPPAGDEDANLAASILAWRDRLPEERALLEHIQGDLEAIGRADNNTNTANATNAANAEAGSQVRTILERYHRALGYVARRWQRYEPDQRWSVFRERLALLRIAYAMGRPEAIMGSVRRMKAAIDRDLRQAIVLTTWSPAVALLIAALGIANLMMVRLNLRARPIAMLRAAGMTRSQVVRLVLAEAVTLGVLGAILGVVLGFYTIRSENIIVEALTALDLPFPVPWWTLGGGILLTVGVCVAAGVRPARHAARDNILAALTVE